MPRGRKRKEQPLEEQPAPVVEEVKEERNWFVIKNITIDVMNVLDSPVAHMMYAMHPSTGVLIDDEVMVLEAEIEPSGPAEALGYIDPTRAQDYINKYVEKEKPQKYRLWLSTEGKCTFSQNGPGLKSGVMICKMKQNDTPPVGRLDSAYAQMLYSALTQKCKQLDAAFRFNVIKGVEMGKIKFEAFKGLMKYLPQKELAEWKKAMEVERISLKTLYNDIKGK